MSEKRILINAVSAKSGGAATYAINLAQQLARGGASHRYIFYVPSGLAKVIPAMGCINVIETGAGEGPAWKRFLWDQIALRAILKREQVDVLISSSDFGMLFPPCRQVLFIRNPLFFSHYYIEHIWPRKTRRLQLDFLLRQKLILLSVRFSDVVMTASQAMMDDLGQFARLSRVKSVVNPFGVPLRNFDSKAEHSARTLEDRSEGPFRMLYVSEYGDYKNFTVLYKALTITADQGFTNITLLTTADPWQNQEAESVTRDEDQALASNPLISPLLQSRGYVSYASIPSLYAECDLFVFPSLVESFGHPLVEAMASKLPILASDSPVCREICGDAALYFSPFDPLDLAEKIIRLRRDFHLRLQLGEAGRKRAGKQFDWRDHVHRLEGLIEEVVADE